MCCNEEQAHPLGRGVWVLDASERNNIHPRLEIEDRDPGPLGLFETRAFGPFLVIRTSAPVRSDSAYLAAAARVMLLGRALGIGDADVNLQTIEQADRKLRGYGPSLRLRSDQLAIARRALERAETRERRAPGAARAQASCRGSGGRRAEDAPDQVRPEHDPGRLRSPPCEDRTRCLAVCFGDLVLDVIVRLEQPLAAGADATSRIVLRPGGQAANVAAWIAELGGRSRWLGKRGSDDAGRLAAARVAAYGVEIAGPVVPAGNGVIVSLVDPDGERSMCSDRGVAPDLQAGRARPGLARGVRPPARIRVRAAARAGAWAVSRAPSGSRATGGPCQRRPVVVERDPRLRAGGISPRARGARAGSRVRERGRGRASWGGPIPGAAWILKRGPRGCSFDGDERAALPVPKLVDSTGAGDALAAGLIVGGPELALEAAARCVQQAGSMP